MFRKLALGLVAAVSLGIAAFAPTSASAFNDGPHFRGGQHHGGGQHQHHGLGQHHGFGMHRGWRDSQAHFRHHGCIQQRLVRTPWGFRYRPVDVCRY